MTNNGSGSGSGGFWRLESYCICEHNIKPDYMCLSSAVIYSEDSNSVIRLKTDSNILIHECLLFSLVRSRLLYNNFQSDELESILLLPQYAIDLMFKLCDEPDSRQDVLVNAATIDPAALFNLITPTSLRGDLNLNDRRHVLEHRRNRLFHKRMFRLKNIASEKIDLKQLSSYQFYFEKNCEDLVFLMAKWTIVGQSIQKTIYMDTLIELSVKDQISIRKFLTLFRCTKFNTHSDYCHGFFTKLMEIFSHRYSAILLRGLPDEPIHCPYTLFKFFSKDNLCRSLCLEFCPKLCEISDTVVTLGETNSDCLPCIIFCDTNSLISILC